MRGIGGVLVAGSLALGCVATKTSVVSLPPLERTLLVRSAENESAIVGTFEVDGRVARGTVTWAATCRRTRLTQMREQRIVRSEPNRAAGVFAGIGAGAVGVAGVGVVSESNDLSGEPICHADTDGDGYDECSSDRENALVGGLLLLGGAVALGAASITTFCAKPTTERIEQIAPFPMTEVLETNLPCGDGPVPRLGLALFRGAERVAASTTDAQGVVVWALPDWLSGSVEVVVDLVPASETLVVSGQVLGSLQIEPGAGL